MAFSNTRRRYASFDTVASIPGEVIDAFWYIIDHHLKGVFPMEPVINFDLVNSHNLLSIRFSQDNSPTIVVIDFDYPFDAAWPREYRAVDNMGRETIMTAREM
ncbi:MAG: DUF960 domain-containing protein [Streptococcaceae bacterium]|nr:DUF960 domain-containing protein [Streptococcaceae bacterium]